MAGTVNDLATAAARPLALAAAFIIEEGFPLADLRDLCASAAATAREAGVPIVTGDTKVVERGAADGLFITTTGVGEIVVAHELGSAAVRDGDAVILSGSIGDHAVAILAARGEFKFSADVRSDCAPLWGLVEAAVAAAREAGGEEALRFLRDPTRGGLTTVLAELAEEAGLGIEVEEAAIPVSPAVRSVCDLLGYDPLTLANEGKMVLVVAPEAADAVVAAVRQTEYGREARRIGFVTAAHPGRVALRTPFGTRRVLDMPVGSCCRGSAEAPGLHQADWFAGFGGAHPPRGSSLSPTRPILPVRCLTRPRSTSPCSSRRASSRLASACSCGCACVSPGRGRWRCCSSPAR